jgi:hypothetical protein
MSTLPHHSVQTMSSIVYMKKTSLSSVSPLNDLDSDSKDDDNDFNKLSCPATPLDVPAPQHTRAPAAPGRSNRRNVTFHEVRIRNYTMTLGDNPACSFGAPVQLDWDFDELPTLQLDDYEQFRKKTRRTKLRHLVLSYYKRLEILQNLGHSDHQLRQATKKIARIKSQRKATVMFAPLWPVEHAFSSAGRKLKRAVAGRPFSVEIPGCSILSTP